MKSPDKPATADERIDHIIKLMLRGEWKGGKSRRDLAAEWGVHERTVGTWADKASAVLSRQGMPIEQEIAQALAELEALQAMAIDHKRAVVVKDDKDSSHVEFVDEPQIQEAINAVKLRMDIRGVTTRAQKGKPAEPDAYDKLTRDERIEKLKEALAEEESAKREEMQ